MDLPQMFLSNTLVLLLLSHELFGGHFRFGHRCLRLGACQAGARSILLLGIDSGLLDSFGLHLHQLLKSDVLHVCLRCGGSR